MTHSHLVSGKYIPSEPNPCLPDLRPQFERLLEEVLPVLHLHFVRQGVKASMYCSQWFLTMFSYRYALPVILCVARKAHEYGCLIRFPMDLVFRIYDNCLASGIEAMFAFSITLLSKNETTLLSMRFDQLVQFLNQRVFDIYQVRLIAHPHPLR